MKIGTCGFFTLELTDSWGDGWNGGSIDVVVNGTTVFAGLTIANGAGPDVYQIPVDIGDVVDFNYTAGSYAGENSYQVFDNNSVLIVDEGPGSSTPTSVTGVSACPACPEPSGLTATNITTSSADLSWTAGGSENEWFVILNGVGTSVSSTSYSATGLSDNTLYNCAVHAICAPGDTSVSASTFSFTTSCNSSLAPTNETFDAGFSSCWSQDQNDDFNWLVDAGGTPSSGTGPSDDFTGGGNYMFTESSFPRASGDVATIYSEVIDISGLTNPQLRFLNHMYGSSMGTLSVDL